MKKKPDYGAIDRMERELIPHVVEEQVIEKTYCVEVSMMGRKNAIQLQSSDSAEIFAIRDKVLDAPAIGWLALTDNHSIRAEHILDVKTSSWKKHS